jgi:hypothetical protein
MKVMIEILPKKALKGENFEKRLLGGPFDAEFQ